MSASAGLDISMLDLQAEVGSAAASTDSRHDAIGRDDALDATDRGDSAPASALAPVPDADASPQVADETSHLLRVDATGTASDAWANWADEHATATDGGAPAQATDSAVATDGRRLEQAADSATEIDGHTFTRAADFATETDGRTLAQQTDSVARTDGDNSDQLAGSATGIDGVTPAITAADSVDSTPLTPAAPDNGGQPSTDSNSGNQQDGSGNGTNTPVVTAYAPAMPVLTVVQDDYNPGLLDPLAWTVADNEPQADDTPSFDIEELIFPSAGPSSGPSAQMGRPDEVVIGGPADFDSGIGWRGDSFALSPWFADEAEPVHGPFAGDPRNDSITAETIPGKSSLSGLNFRDQAASDDLKHVAELSPLDQSSALALAATLWTTSSQLRLGSEPGLASADEPTRDVQIEPVTPSWKVFVMGLDQAFERSYRDVCRGPVFTAENERSRREAADRIEWRGPIVPGAAPAVVKPYREAVETGDSATRAQVDGSILPAVFQLGEFFFENFLDPVLGHENGSNGDSQ